jgi:hypothetical protein
VGVTNLRIDPVDTTFDTQLGRCHFLPYIGADYSRSTQRLLVLGESHYVPKHPDIPPRELTRRVVGDVLERGEKHRFLTSVALAASGVPGPGVAFWTGVSFYNYVQEFAGTAPRQRPRLGAWTDAVPAFRQVLGALKPHLVLVCGKTLWEQLKRQPALSDYPVKASEDERTRSRVFNGEAGWSCVGGMLHHPASFGFRALEWHPRVVRYRARATEHAQGLAAEGRSESLRQRTR